MSSHSGIKDSDVPPDRYSLYQEILDNLPAAVYLCDANGYVRNYNEAAARLWGRDPEIGKDLWCGSWKIFDTAGNPMPLADGPMAVTLRTHKPVRGREIIIERPDGARFNVQPYPEPLFDNAGNLTGAVNMLLDVTAQRKYKDLEKRADDLAKLAEELHTSEQRYHRMISEVEDYAIIRLSKEGIIENWNKGAERIKGYSDQEILGKHFRTFYPPEDQASKLPETLIGRAEREGKANHEGWRVRKDGSRFWGSISITAIHDTAGAVIGFVKVTRDLTERHNHELESRKYFEDLKVKNEMLKQSEERYQRMVAEVEDYVIILLDSKGYIQNWNKGVEKIKGYSADEIVGKHFSVFYGEEDRRQGLPDRILSEARRNGKALHEGWRWRKNGSAFWGSVVMTALHGPDGNVIGFTKVTRDLTEKRLADERLMASAAALERKNKELERMNEELSSFAYVSSHDLQEPLRKIQTFSDRILELEFEKLSPKGKEYLQRMRAGAARMQKLIRDILAYSRTTTAERMLELSDLNELLAQAKTELEEPISLKKAIIESDFLPTIRAIPFQVQQLFYNLLSNSLKFAKPDERPRIRVKSETVDPGRLPDNVMLQSKRHCHISFSDNGIGFEAEFSRKIFEVFQRLHGRNEYDGTGIGLAICKKIVENHDGMITADSAPGEGSTFHIWLPV